jgi:hypothetical protein
LLHPNLFLVSGTHPNTGMAPAGEIFVVLYVLYVVLLFILCLGQANRFT